MVTEQIATLSYTLTGDSQPLDQKFKQIEQKWDALAKKVASKPLALKVALDDRSVDQAIAKLTQKLERGVKPIKIRIDTGELEQQLARVQQRLGGGGAGGYVQHRNALGQFAGQSPAIGLAGVAAAATAGTFSGRWLAGNRFAGSFGPPQPPAPDVFRGSSFTPTQKAALIGRAVAAPFRFGAAAIGGAARLAGALARPVAWGAAGLYQLLHHEPQPPPTLEENVQSMRDTMDHARKRYDSVPSFVANISGHVHAIRDRLDAAGFGSSRSGGGGGGGGGGIGGLAGELGGIGQQLVGARDEMASYARDQYQQQTNLLRYQRVIARKLYARSPRGGRSFGGGGGPRVSPEVAARMMAYAQEGEFALHDPYVTRATIEEDFATAQPAPAAAAEGPLFPDIDEGEDYGRGRLAKGNRIRRQRNRSRRADKPFMGMADLSAAENPFDPIKNLAGGTVGDKAIGGGPAGALGAFEAALNRATKALGSLTGATGKGSGGGNAASSAGRGGNAAGRARDGQSAGQELAGLLPRGMRGAIAKFGIPLAIAGAVSSIVQTHNEYQQQGLEEAASYNQGAVGKLSMAAQRRAMEAKTFSGGDIPVVGGVLSEILSPAVLAYQHTHGGNAEDLARQARELSVQQSFHLHMMGQAAGVNATVRQTRAAYAGSFGATYGGMVSAYEEEKGVADQNAIALQQVQDSSGAGSARYMAQEAVNDSRAQAAGGRRATRLRMVGREAAIGAYGVTQGAKAMGLTANGQGAAGQFGALAAGMQPDILRAKEEYQQLETAFVNAPRGSKEANIAWNLANQANLKWHGLQDQLRFGAQQLGNQFAGQYAASEASNNALGFLSDARPYLSQQTEIQAGFIPQILAERGDSQTRKVIRDKMVLQQTVNAKQFGSTYYASALQTEALDDSARANRMALNRDYRGAEMLSAESATRQQLASLDPRQFKSDDDFQSRRRALIGAGGAAAANRIKELEMPSPMEVSGGISSGFQWSGNSYGVEKEFSAALADEKRNAVTGENANAPAIKSAAAIDALITKWEGVADQLKDTLNRASQ